MRESNFAFPAQNRASVSISSQLYDRRALDSNSALPLYNSLTHLTYLTSTSPRIREIMTYDGGLERLVQLLREFCLHPPPADSGALMYGLAPPPLRPLRRTPVLTPTLVDKNAQARFTLAFQSLVNIGVRGSEEIRGRVVQAGTLDVVGCILEAWLVSRGFSLGPSSNSSHPRETREQRTARRAAQAEARQRQQAAELERALRRQIDAEQRVAARQAAIQAALHRARAHDIPSNQDTPPPPPERHASSTSTSEANSDAEPSAVVTPGHGTPTGVVTVPGRERSGTVIGRPEWETGTIRGRRPVIPADMSESSADASRAETETEDDADVDMDRSMTVGLDRTRMATIPPHVRRAVGIVTDQPEAGPSMATPSDPTHIIVAPDTVVPGEGVGVEDGLVALESNDDFALGAPPGAPGAIDGAVPALATVSPTPDRMARLPADTTPRAMMATLPPQDPSATPFGTRADLRTNTHQRATLQPLPVNQNAQANTANAHVYLHHHQEHHRNDGPYRDEEVLLALQLLAYLSKYPHVRQAFYKPRTSFHPAAVPAPAPTANAHGHAHGHPHPHQQPVAGSSNINSTPLSERHSIFRAFASVRGREKRPAPVPSAQSNFNQLPMQPEAPAPPQRVVNVFSLVERFTFRPSSSENEGYGAGQLPPEIQYWAGVIMRNACRKDDTRGGIRQCANMLCGRWETFPREFAKCRRCRKAKYCGKECQSTAWSEGHRFWCSAKDADDDVAQAAAHGRADLLSQRVVVNVVDGTTTTVPVMEGAADLNAEDIAVAGADQDSVPLQRTLVALNAMRQTLQAEQVDQPHRTTAPAQPAGAAAAAELMELLLRREQVAANVAGAGTQTALPTGWDWAAAAAGVRMIQAGVGVDDPLPAPGQDDPFMDPVLQHGFFAPGGGPAGEGMTVEDGVVRVDDDIVRVEENLTLRPRGTMDGAGLSRTAGAEDAMVLD